MCHDSATKLLSVFIKNKNCLKCKKPANPRICRFYHVFYGFLKRLKKLPLFLLPFWWGEQDSNFTPETAVYATFIYVLNLCAPILHPNSILLFQYENILKILSTNELTDSSIILFVLQIYYKYLKCRVFVNLGFFVEFEKSPFISSAEKAGFELLTRIPLL